MQTRLNLGLDILISGVYFHADQADCSENFVSKENPVFHKCPQNHPFLILVTLAAVILASCSMPVNTPTAQPPLEAASSTPPAAEASPTPQTQPLVNTATPAANATQPDSTTQPAYLDDRSTPTGLMNSYFNAVNRKEYLRAYSYWRNPATSVGSFDAFQQGYEKTTSVDVTLGQISGDPGAGQMYYSVPAVLKTQTSDGNPQVFAACYILHISQPTFQATPPFSPLGIEKAAAKQADASAKTADLLAQACIGPDFPQGSPINPAPVTHYDDISSQNYLDDRSSPIQVINSLFNAINRQEYLRAYSYWKYPENTPSSFEKFQKGYANTKTVEATFGKTTSDAGAGQLYYKVPVSMKVLTTDNQTQVYVGCYTLHLSQPGVQATPPFQPLAITAGDFKLIGAASLDSSLAAACNS